jgi:SAM-dependent methyltransferase
VRQRWLARWLFDPPVGPVLDLGCGDGRFAYWNRRRAHIVGVDATPLFARQAAAAVDLVQADGRALPFDDGTFRAAYSIDVLEHLDLAGLDGVLAEARRVLRPGSRFFIFTNSREPSTFQPVIALQQRAAAALRRNAIGDFGADDLRKADHVKALATFEDFVALAARHGFVVRRRRFWNGVAQGWVDNVIVRAGEHLLLGRRGQPSLAAVNGSLPEAADQITVPARQVVSRRPAVAGALAALTLAMQADVAVLGGFRSGPFFALLERR